MSHIIRVTDFKCAYWKCRLHTKTPVLREGQLWCCEACWKAALKEAEEAQLKYPQQEDVRG